MWIRCAVLMLTGGGGAQNHQTGDMGASKKIPPLFGMAEVSVREKGMQGIPELCWRHVSEKFGLAGGDRFGQRRASRGVGKSESLCMQCEEGSRGCPVPGESGIQRSVLACSLSRFRRTASIARQTCND